MKWSVIFSPAVAALVSSYAHAQDVSSQANTVYRDYNVPGNAVSGAYNPPKSLVRGLWAMQHGLNYNIAGTRLAAGTVGANAAYLGLGPFATATALPLPTPTVLGGVHSAGCASPQFVNGIDTATGNPTCATPTTGTSTTAAGSSGQFQTNSGGALAGVTISGAVSISGTTGVATLAAGQAVANLGYTPVNKAGDTMTGALAVPFVGSQQILTSAPAGTLNSGVIEVNRQSSYTGGSGVSPSLHVASTAGPATTDFNWGVLSEMDSLSATGENVAIYGQARKHGAGPVWGGVFEARDMFATSGNPVNPMWGLEVDVMGYGADINKQRIGVDIVFGRHDHSDAGIYHLGTGLRFNPWPADLTAGKVIIDSLIAGAVPHIPATVGIDLVNFDFGGNVIQTSNWHVANFGGNFVRNTVTPADQTSYSFSTGIGVGANDLTLGADASNTYVQSWAAKPLVINSQGNSISLAGPVYLFNQATTGGAIGTVCATSSGQIFIKTSAGSCI
jgi:hypothetical protein